MLARLHGQMNKPMVMKVSEELKRSVKAVRRRYYQFYPIPEEDKPRPWTVEEDEALKRLCSTRMSVPDIARQLGRGVSPVHKRRLQLRIAADRLKPHILYTPVMDKTIVQMYRLRHLEDHRRTTWTPFGGYQVSR